MNMRMMRWRYATGRSLDFTKAAEWRAEQVQPLLPESYQPHRTGPPQTLAPPSSRYGSAGILSLKILAILC
jgi:hypothetical protein